MQARFSFGILGPNGAGKTTLLRPLTGLTPRHFWVSIAASVTLLVVVLLFAWLSFRGQELVTNS